MKILFVTEVYPPTVGGTAVFAERLARQLVKRGHEVFVLTTAPKMGLRTHRVSQQAVTALYHVPSVPYPFNPTNNRMTLLPLVSTTKAIFKLRPDCIHMHTPLGMLHRLIMPWAQLKKIPVIITNHVMPENLYLNSTFLGKLQRPVAHVLWRDTIGYANAATHVTAPTPTALGMLEKHGLRSPGTAITNGIDTDFFSPAAPDKQVLKEMGINGGFKHHLLYLGRLDGEKRIDLLLRALPKILEKEPDTQLIIAGRGVHAPRLKALARELKIRKNVEFVGLVSEEQKRELMRFADAFVIASPAELQCIAALEALACGTPLVTANVAALTELDQDGKNGYPFNYPSEKDLAKVVVKLLEDPKKRQAMSKHARDWVVKHHAQAITVTQYESLYKHVVKSPAHK